MIIDFWQSSTIYSPAEQCQEYNYNEVDRVSIKI